MLLVFLAVLIITGLTLFDILSRDPALVRLLPKPFWAILVILLPLIGVILWFAVGRRPEPATTQRTIIVHESVAPAAPAAAPRPSGPLSTEEQLAALEREIEEDHRARRIAELEAELRRRRTDGDTPAEA
jgi:hypothetical protein